MMHARRHIGFRGTTLLYLAAVWFGVGLTLIIRPDPDMAHMYPLEYLPLWVRVCLWWVAAAVAVITAFWPEDAERWGFAILSLPVLFRACSYAATGILEYPHALVDAVVWTAVFGFVINTAQWPEPPRRRPDLKDGEPW